jgi:hypothetical protein
MVQTKNPILRDLYSSGILIDTAKAAGIRQGRDQDLPTGLRGKHLCYIIPYRELDGKLIESTDFQRIKLLPGATDADGKTVKYLQPPDTQSRLYVPPTAVMPQPISDEHPSWWLDTTVPIIITEGEKKALCGAQFLKNHMAVVGLGGVNSWRTRTIKFAADKVIQQRTHYILRTNDEFEVQELQERIVPELLQIKWPGRRVFIVFDSDQKFNPNVQHSAFELGIWLDSRGANVSQCFLPRDEGVVKVGLDDYIVNLVAEGIDPQTHLVDFILGEAWTFPYSPDPKPWVQSQLNSKGSRAGQQKVSRAIIATLDHLGQRFFDTRRQYYYFHRPTKVLHEFQLNANELRQLRLSSIGTLIYGQFGVSTTDTNVLSRVADGFAAIEPIAEVKPRVISTTDDLGDVFYYQISDSRFVRVSAFSIDITDNGTDDVLFRSAQVEPINERALIKALAGANQRARGLGHAPTPWPQKLRTTTIMPLEGLTHDQTITFLTCLFHLSPWLRRWRGLMLPFELAIGEPGSGKSFVSNLRKLVYTGNPGLDSHPNELRDWYAAISKSPFWVCDNLGDIRGDFRQTLSDEIARIITDPDPSFSLRELYTTDVNLRVTTDCVFAATAVTNPFTKPDLLQRSIVYYMQAVPMEKRDGSWFTREIPYREYWVAYHLTAIQHFLYLVSRKWDGEYLSRHRLVNFEQSILLMGQALGYSERVMKDIIKALPGAIQHTISNQDPVIDALKTYRMEIMEPQGKTVKTKVTSRDVVNWAQNDIDSRFTNLRVFQSPVALGRYLNSHAYDVLMSAGLKVDKEYNYTTLTKVDQADPANAKPANGKVKVEAK